MATPDESVTLTPQQIEVINTRLADTRHDINNQLSLIIAAVELIKRKPETSEKMIATISQQPEKIMNELRGFSEDFEKVLSITRD
ncbi:MAG: hypothetical protein ACPGVU_08305 [Limisphaerales bacterium]